MNFRRYLLAATLVGVISLLYNFLIFSVFNFYPDFVSEILEISPEAFYVFVFFKGFVTGFVLSYFFNIGYTAVNESVGGMELFKGILYLSLYAIFALAVFAIGDLFLMRSQEGLFVLVTVDGFVETIIATVPIRFFCVNC